MQIDEFRKSYPMYDGMSDNELALKLHAKNYSHVPYADFAAKFGVERETAAYDFVEEMGKGVVRGFINVADGLLGTAELLIPGEPTKGIRANMEQASKGFAPDIESAAGWAGRVIGETIPYMGAAMTAAYGAGGLAGTLGATAKGIGVARGAGAALVAFSVGGEQAYQNAIKSGATEFEAQTERMIVGSINAAIEALQITRLLKFHASGKNSLKAIVGSIRNKAWKSAIKEGAGFTAEILKTSITEGLEELTQEAVSVGVPWALRDDVPRRADGKVDIWALGLQLGGAALGGAVAGGVLGGGGAAIGSATAVARPTGTEISTARTEVAGSNKLTAQQKKDILYELDELEGVEKVETTEKQPAINVYRGVDTGTLFRDESKLKMEKTETGTRLVDIATGEEAILDQEASSGALSFSNEVETSRKKLKESIEKMEQLRPEEEADIKKKLGKRLGKAEDIYRDETNPYIAMAKARGALKGALKMEFAPLRDQFTDAEFDSLFKEIQVSNIDFTEQSAAWNGLQKLILDGKLPATHEIRAMDKVFGKDITNAIVRKRQEMGSVAFKVASEIFNMPRALLASYDISFPLRQGRFILFTKPKAWWRGTKAGYRAYASEDYTRFATLKIKSDPYYDRFIKSGGEITEVGSLIHGEEFFGSAVASKIPGIPASERAYVTTANTMRFETFKQIAQGWEGTGKSRADYKQLADMVNVLTGRGNVKMLEKFVGDKMLNITFFAPRLQMGRIQSITNLFKYNAPTRKILAHTLMKAFGTGISVLTLASMIKGVEVEKDPRSTDFGRIRIGNTRIDFFDTYQQIFRMIARIVSGEVKSTETGRTYPAEWNTEILRFFQSKLSPVAGLALDIARGETYRGEKLKMTPEFLTEQSLERLTPLFLRDLYESAKYQGLSGVIPAATLGLHGIGVMTYPVTTQSELAKLQDGLSREVFQQRWDEISQEAQGALTTYEPQITLLKQKARMERENFGFMAKMAQEENDAKNYVLKKLPKTLRAELTNTVTDIKGFSRFVGSDWYLNDRRYKEYQNSSAKLMVDVIPKVIDSLDWESYTPEMKQTILRELIDRIKSQVRSKIMNEATINDLQKLR